MFSSLSGPSILSSIYIISSPECLMTYFTTSLGLTVSDLTFISASSARHFSIFNFTAPVSSCSPPSKILSIVTLPIPRAGTLMIRFRSESESGFKAPLIYESTSRTSFRSKNFVPMSSYANSFLIHASSITRDWKLAR